MNLLSPTRLSFVAALMLPIVTFSAEPAKPYEDQDGWRMLQRALPVALKENPKAIHDCFLASYLRVSSPYLGGEDCEAIISGLSEILFRSGDKKFCQALALERPEVIAAVKLWIRNSPGFYRVGAPFKKLSIDDYPRTKKLLDAAPDTDFPYNESSPRRAPLLKHLEEKNNG